MRRPIEKENVADHGLRPGHYLTQDTEWGMLYVGHDFEGLARIRTALVIADRYRFWAVRPGPVIHDSNEVEWGGLSAEEAKALASAFVTGLIDRSTSLDVLLAVASDLG